MSALGQKQTCTRHVGRVIALSVEPARIRVGGVLLAREQRRLSAVADVVGSSYAAYEQIYYSSLMPRTDLCAQLLETLD